MPAGSNRRSPITTSAPVATRGIEQPRRLLRQVLHIAVEQQHVRKVAAQDMCKPGAHCVSLAQVRGVRNDVSAGGPRLVAVPSLDPSSTTITCETNGRTPRDDLGDGRRFIVGRYQRGHVHRHDRVVLIINAGSRIIDAQRQREHADAETSPIERNGGYEDVISVPYPNSVIAAAARMTGASSDTVLVGVSPLSISMHHVDAVVDADADERHDGKDREQIELDTGERQHSAVQSSPAKVGQQRERAQSPVSKHEHERSQHHDGADRQAFEELRQEPSRQLHVDERKPGQRLRRIDRIDNRLKRRQLVRRSRKHVRRQRPFSAVREMKRLMRSRNPCET